MKKTILKLLFLSYLLITMHQLNAQGPPEPPADPASGGNEVVGGNAPIGNGFTILLTLCAVYGTRKFYQLSTKVSIEE